MSSKYNNIQQTVIEEPLVMYEAITIMAKRRTRSILRLKKELTEKLEEFCYLMIV
jgi:hypothetical protein